MKSKRLSLVIAALLAAGGLWFAWSAWRTPEPAKPRMGAGSETTSDQKPNMRVSMESPTGPPQPGRMLRPPDPTRRFTDFTPEQRVQFARQGHGPGG